MNALDYVVLFACILGIALYGILRTRGRRTLHDYLRGKKQSWFLIGLSVMATQASAITFISTPGQGYQDGMSFIQNYFAVPLAMVIIAAFFLPIYRKLNVYTAYEFLSNRFDRKTRLLAAALFLLQRGLGAGYTIYAPAIVLSTVFGWSLSATIIGSGVVTIIYTAVGGSDAVTHTQKFQIGVIFAGMIAAFVILLHKIPCSFPDALVLAGHFGKTNTVNFHFDVHNRYTFWSGMLGGTFLMLSYFGTDQSQVQRYISGDNLRESRLGLMFNALLKIPMQFFILLLGVMLYVFYLFNPAPVFFNRTAVLAHGIEPAGTISFSSGGFLETPQAELNGTYSLYRGFEAMKQDAISKWLEARHSGDAAKQAESLIDVQAAVAVSNETRSTFRSELHNLDPQTNANDSDYVFIDFILDNLPHGLIGLLVACFFAAAISSKAAELNALATCTIVDFYRYLFCAPHTAGKPGAISRDIGVPPMQHRQDADATSDRHYVRASKLFTILWGIAAVGIALCLRMSENLIQATNILASLFYPTILSLFLIGFFLKFISAGPAFIGALVAQAAILTLYFTVPDATLSYLWYNPLGVAICITVATALEPIIGKPKDPQGFPVEFKSTAAE